MKKKSKLSQKEQQVCIDLFKVMFRYARVCNVEIDMLSYNFELKRVNVHNDDGNVIRYLDLTTGDDVYVSLS